LPSRCMSPFSAAVICAYPTNKTTATAVTDIHPETKHKRL
jgi:hypothetical protein